MPNSGKMASQRVVIGQKFKGRVSFLFNFLKQSVTKIKNAAHPRQKFSEYPEDGGPLKKDMTFSSMFNYT